MAGFNVNQADNYGGQGGGGFFSLRNDKDIAKVRILYQDINDVMGYSVHEVELGGKKRYVNCLREYGDLVDACPFCKAGRFTQVKYFVPIYTESIVSNGAETPVGSLQTWERGKKFGSKLTSICSRYPNVVAHTFEIERNGKAGDTQTTYEIFETGETPDVSIDQFDVPNPLGTIILDKSPDEMETYLRTGDFGDGAPQRRDNYGSNNGGYQNNNNGGFTRRTPAGESGNGGRRSF